MCPPSDYIAAIQDSTQIYSVKDLKTAIHEDYIAVAARVETEGEGEKTILYVQDLFFCQIKFIYKFKHLSGIDKLVFHSLGHSIFISGTYDDAAETKVLISVSVAAAAKFPDDAFKVYKLDFTSPFKDMYFLGWSNSKVAVLYEQKIGVFEFFDDRKKFSGFDLEASREMVWSGAENLYANQDKHAVWILLTDSNGRFMIEKMMTGKTAIKEIFTAKFALPFSVNPDVQDDRQLISVLSYDLYGSEDIKQTIGLCTTYLINSSGTYGLDIAMLQLVNDDLQNTQTTRLFGAEDGRTCHGTVFQTNGRDVLFNVLVSDLVNSKLDLFIFSYGNNQITRQQGILMNSERSSIEYSYGYPVQFMMNENNNEAYFLMPLTHSKKQSFTTIGLVLTNDISLRKDSLWQNNIEFLRPIFEEFTGLDPTDTTGSTDQGTRDITISDPADTAESTDQGTRDITISLDSETTVPPRRRRLAIQYVEQMSTRFILYSPHVKYTQSLSDQVEAGTYIDLKEGQFIEPEIDVPNGVRVVLNNPIYCTISDQQKGVYTLDMNINFSLQCNDREFNYPLTLSSFEYVIKSQDTDVQMTQNELSSLNFNSQPSSQEFELVQWNRNTIVAVNSVQTTKIPIDLIGHSVTYTFKVLDSVGMTYELQNTIQIVDVQSYLNKNYTSDSFTSSGDEDELDSESEVNGCWWQDSYYIKDENNDFILDKDGNRIKSELEWENLKEDQCKEEEFGQGGEDYEMEQTDWSKSDQSILDEELPKENEQESQNIGDQDQVVSMQIRQAVRAYKQSYWKRDAVLEAFNSPMTLIRKRISEQGLVDIKFADKVAFPQPLVFQYDPKYVAEIPKVEPSESELLDFVAKISQDNQMNPGKKRLLSTEEIYQWRNNPNLDYTLKERIKIQVEVISGNDEIDSLAQDFIFEIAEVSEYDIKLNITFANPEVFNEKQTLLVSFDFGDFMPEWNLNETHSIIIPRQLSNSEASKNRIETVQVLETIIQQASIGSVFATAIGSVSMVHGWNMLNGIESLCTLPLVKVSFPPFTASAFDKVGNIQRMEFIGSKNVIYAQFSNVNQEIDEMKVTQMMLSMGYDSNYFLMTLGMSFLFLYLIIIQVTVYFLTNLFTKNRKIPCCVSIRYKSGQNLFWNTFLRFIILTSMDVSIGLAFQVVFYKKNSDAQVYEKDMDSKFGVVNMTVMIILCIFCFGALLLSIFFYVPHFDQWQDKDFDSKYGTVLLGLRKDKKTSIGYMIIFFLRRIALIALIIKAEDFNTLTSFAFFFVSITLVLVYFIEFRPFDNDLSRQMDYFNEITLLCLAVLALSYSEANPSYQSIKYFDAAFVLLLALNIGINNFLLLKETAFYAKGKLKKLYHKLLVKKLKHTVIQKDLPQDHQPPPPQQEEAQEQSNEFESRDNLAVGITVPPDVNREAEKQWLPYTLRQIAEEEENDSRLDEISLHIPQPGTVFPKKISNDSEPELERYSPSEESISMNSKRKGRQSRPNTDLNNLDVLISNQNVRHTLMETTIGDPQPTNMSIIRQSLNISTKVQDDFFDSKINEPRNKTALHVYNKSIDSTFGLTASAEQPTTRTPDLNQKFNPYQNITLRKTLVEPAKVKNRVDSPVKVSDYSADVVDLPATFNIDPDDYIDIPALGKSTKDWNKAQKSIQIDDYQMQRLHTPQLSNRHKRQKESKSGEPKSSNNLIKDRMRFDLTSPQKQSDQVSNLEEIVRIESLGPDDESSFDGAEPVNTRFQER